MKGRLALFTRGLLSSTLFALLTGSALAQGLVLNGSARQQWGVVRLTPAAQDQAGSAWTAQRQRVQFGFVTSFRFRISEAGGIIDESGPPGADGFSFGIQNAGASALGGGGGGIGYDGIPNSLVVEFDTWRNFELGDPNSNHISVHTRGTGPNTADESASLGSTSAIPNLADGNFHAVTISYQPPDGPNLGRLDVALDGSLVLSVRVNLATTLTLDQGAAYVGFTAGTGAAFESHDILSWSFRAF
jgi:hypothetical protein